MYIYRLAKIFKRDDAERKPNTRIESLDGIRGVSILMVLLAHAATSFPKLLTNTAVFRIFSNGHTGVMIFFVISGYLITKLLLIERDKKGQISIKDFYIRRFLRIFPVFYIYIAVVMILKHTVYPGIFTDYTTIFFAALYIWNYKHLLTGPSYHETNGNWFMGHLWSLSMEEQFYLIWPFTFKKIPNKKLINVVIILIIIIPVLRIVTYACVTENRNLIIRMLHTGGDTILIGCLGALLERSEKFMNFLKNLWSKKWIVVTAFLYLFPLDWYLTSKFGEAYSVFIGYSLSNVAILFLILWCIYVPSPVYRFLNTPWVMQIGTISYSLYIWQQLILTKKYVSFTNTLPFNFIAVFLIAFMSYYLIEKPILKLRNKFQK